MSEKTRWIIPIQSTGRIEVSVNVNNQCKIEMYDNKNEKLGDKGTISEEELYEFIEILRAARSLINERANRPHGEEYDLGTIAPSADWCCDPEDGGRPRGGCNCRCCAQARGLQTAEPEFDEVDVVSLMGGQVETIRVRRE